MNPHSLPVPALDSVPPHGLTIAAAEERVFIARLLADDAAAWREFNERYARLISSCIARVTARFGFTSPDDVREIYATLCLQLLSNDKRKLRTFEPHRGARFSSWLGLLATHTAYDFLRSVRHAPRLAELGKAAGLSSELPDPSEATLLRERGQLLSRALAALSAKDREFIELYFGQGLPVEEVAQRMRISVKTVYTKKHKLQSRLQGLLEEPLLAA